MWNMPSYPAGYYPQQAQQPMPVQPIQTIQQSAQVYFVEDPRSLDSIRPSLNVLYVGVNTKGKEIYVKQLTNDGTVATDKYVLAENKKEKGREGGRVIATEQCFLPVSEREREKNIKKRTGQNRKQARTNTQTIT